MVNPVWRYRIRKTFRPLGFGPLHHKRDMEGVARHCRDDMKFYPSTLIDVGVACGTYELYRIWPKARLVLVEPVVEFEPSLKYICRTHRGGGVYHLAAAGAETGTISIEAPDGFIGDLGVAGTGGARSVPVRTLDDLIGESDVQPPFLLKIDVQGAEAGVLRGASWTLQHADLVMLEMPLFQYEPYTTPFSEMVSLMASLGFAPYDIYDGLLRPHDLALGQIDVAFVKSDGSFRRSSAWGTMPDSLARRTVQRVRNLLGV